MRDRAGRAAATRMRHSVPGGHRPGEWAILAGLDRVAGNDCYLVEYPDGTTAWWPVVPLAGWEYEIEHLGKKEAAGG